jgi:signal transduction histidine kinase
MTSSLRIESIVRGARGSRIGGRPKAGHGFSAELGRVPSPVVEPASPSHDRLRALLDAGLALTSELSLEAVLQRLVEAAAQLTTARYAALGVIDRSGQELERFVTTGVDPETYEAIGDLPRGRGILGVLIRDARTLRLHDITADPRSVGFPANHPPMRSFLGVPILLRGTAYGNLYLTEKEGGGDFTDDDEELVTLLASQAAVAIENARLYEATALWSRQLESLNEVGDALVTETDLERLLDLIARRLRELLQARLVAVVLPTGSDELRFTAVAGEAADELQGRTISRQASKSGRVLERGRTERVESMLDDAEIDRTVSRLTGALTGLWVPLVVHGRPIGVMEVHDKVGSDPRFSDNDQRLAETFAARAAVAVDLSQRIARDAFRRVVDAQETERRRLARELHDETGQALTSILLGLKALEESADPGAVGQLRQLVVGTLQDVRRLAVELRPPVLDDFGLDAALERLTSSFSEQTGMPVRFESNLGDVRLPEEVETALYRIVQEALTNVVKHAQAQSVSVVLSRNGDSAVAFVEDDGQGFDPKRARPDGFGVEGMRERVALLDGHLRLESRPGGGTTIVAEVPLR